MGEHYSYGIEEEYFVVSTQSRNTLRFMPRSFIETARERMGPAVMPEMLQSQVEVATEPFSVMGDGLKRLRELRSGLADIAAEHDLMIVAAGTHPIAAWSKQRSTEAARYDKVIHDLQMVGMRNLICGMHVHVALPDPSRRVNVMNRMMPYLPLLLALSTSSPFWSGRRTGLMSYRIAANHEMPRAGVPEIFADEADYDRYITTLVASGAIKDASYIWWLLRPSMNHPTLELRVTDSCTNVAHSIAIAALYRALVRHVDRNPAVNSRLTGASRAIVCENLWRAQRYGVHGSFVDEEQQRSISVGDMLEEVLVMVAADAQALDCFDEARACLDIVKSGTSADFQIAMATEAEGRGQDRRKALEEVVDWLAAETAGRNRVPVPHPQAA